MATTVNPMGPAGPWPQSGLDARQAMLNWYQTVLAEAQKRDPAASLETPGGGMGILTIKGQKIPLTSIMKGDADQGITAAQMLDQKESGGLMNLTPEQNQAQFDRQLAAINQAGGGAQVQAGMQQATTNTTDPSATPNRMMVGNTSYDTALQGGKLVQSAPQSFAPTAGGGGAETRQTYPDTGALGSSPFGGYSVTPPTGGSTIPLKKVLGSGSVRRPTDPRGLQRQTGGYRLRDLNRRSAFR